MRRAVRRCSTPWRHRRMGALVDHVPNHVAVGRPELNAPWWAMLRDGPDSAGRPLVRRRLGGGGRPVILPVLGDPLDVDRLERRDGELHLGDATVAAGARAPSSCRSTSCSPGSTTACSTGRIRRATSAASSPSTTSSPCASSTPRSPRPSTPCPRLLAEPPGVRRGARRPRRRAGRPADLPHRAAGDDRTRIAGCSWRRSSPPASACPTPGRSTARPATSTPRRSSTPCSTVPAGTCCGGAGSPRPATAGRSGPGSSMPAARSSRPGCGRTSNGSPASPPTGWRPTSRRSRRLSPRSACTSIATARTSPTPRGHRR